MLSVESEFQFSSALSWPFILQLQFCNFPLKSLGLIDWVIAGWFREKNCTAAVRKGFMASERGDLGWIFGLLQNYIP